MSKSGKRWLSGPRIDPGPVRPHQPVAELMDETFLAYNAGRLQKAAELFVRKMLAPDCWVGASLSGALTPAGLGGSVLIPMIRARKC